MSFLSFLKLVILLNISNFVRLGLCSEVEELIAHSAEAWVSPDRDLIEEGHEVFYQQKSKHQAITLAAEKYPEKRFRVPEDAIFKKNIIIIDKQQDGLDPSETQTRVVLIPSFQKRQIYTAHITYIRSIDDEISVEWDYYEARPVLEYKSFYTALSPGEYYQNSRVADQLRGNSSDRPVLGFLAHIRKNLLDVACLVTVFIPRWCRKYNIKPLKIGDMLAKNKTSTSSKVIQNGREYSFEDYRSSFFEISESVEEIPRRKSENRPIPLLQKTNSNNKNNIPNQGLKGATTDPSKGTLERNWTLPGSEQVNTTDDSQLSSSLEKFKSYFRNDNDTSEKVKLPHPLEPGSTSESDSHESELEDNEDRGRMKTQSKIPEPVSSKKTTTPNRPHSNKLKCPAHSGAILEKDKCHCPLKTVLQGRKCLNRTTTPKKMIQGVQSDGMNLTDGVWKLKQADASLSVKSHIEFYDGMPPKPKRQVDQESESFDAEIVPSKPLGPFYKPVQLIHFDKDVAHKVLERIPTRALEFLQDRYRIANNPVTGHAEYESERTPFTGIMDCRFEERKLNSFNSTLKHNIVDYLLYASRAQCHRNLRKNILKLFDRGIVQIKKSPHYYFVVLKDHWFLNQDVYSKQEWQDFVSAIYISCFSKAIGEQQTLLDRGLIDNISPDRQRISRTIRTLTVFVEKVMRLLKQTRFRNHAVKITKALVSTISSFTQRVHKEEFLVELFCKACRDERVVFNQNLRQLYVLHSFVIVGFQDVVHNYMTFDEFYNSVDANFG